jgi:hypothetical protein
MGRDRHQHWAGGIESLPTCRCNVRRLGPPSRVERRPRKVPMQASQTHPLNGRSSTSWERIGGNTELARLRETCRRQAIVIDALTAALRTLRDGAMALRAENAELRAIEAMPPMLAKTRHDAIAAAALIVIRRSLVEGVPVTRTGLAETASVALGAPPEDAVREVDAVAQRLGVSSLN